MLHSTRSATCHSSAHIVLVLALCLSCLPIATLAQDDALRSGTREIFERLRNSAVYEFDIWLFRRHHAKELQYLEAWGSRASRAIQDEIESLNTDRDHAYRYALYSVLGRTKDPTTIEWLNHRFAGADSRYIRAWLSGWTHAYNYARVTCEILHDLQAPEAWSEMLHKLTTHPLDRGTRTLLHRAMYVYFHDAPTLDYMERLAASESTRSHDLLLAMTYLQDHGKAIDGARLATHLSDVEVRTTTEYTEIMNVTPELKHEALVPWLIAQEWKPGSHYRNTQREQLLRTMTMRGDISGQQAWTRWYDAHGAKGRDGWTQDAIGTIDRMVAVDPHKAADALRDLKGHDHRMIDAFARWSSHPELHEALMDRLAELHPYWRPRVRPLMEDIHRASGHLLGRRWSCFGIGGDSPPRDPAQPTLPEKPTAVQFDAEAFTRLRSIPESKDGVLGNHFFDMHANPKNDIRTLCKLRFVSTQPVCAEFDTLDVDLRPDYAGALLHILGSVKDPQSIPWLRNKLVDGRLPPIFVERWLPYWAGYDLYDHYSIVKWLTGTEAWRDFFLGLLKHETDPDVRLRLLKAMYSYLHDDGTIAFFEARAAEPSTTGEELLVAMAYLHRHRRPINGDKLRTFLDGLDDSPDSTALVMPFVGKCPHEAFVEWILARPADHWNVPDRGYFFAGQRRTPGDIDHALHRITYAGDIRGRAAWLEWYDQHKSMKRSEWIATALAAFEEALETNPVEGRKIFERNRGAWCQPEIHERIPRWCKHEEMRPVILNWLALVPPAWVDPLRPITEQLIRQVGDDLTHYQADWLRGSDYLPGDYWAVQFEGWRL